MTHADSKLPLAKKRTSRGSPIEPVPDISIPRDEFLFISKKYHSHLKENLPSLRSAGISGMDFVRQYSRTVDAIVRVVFQRAAHENGVAPGKTQLGVIAMGGYGRAELAPYSDVDILILSKRKTPMVKTVASSFIRLMWDVGFELGHSVQSLVESESVLARNMDARTALMESRWVCGSREMEGAVKRQISQLRKRDTEPFLKRKIKDALQRHRKYGRSYQLVEPNVKLSPGGLRDYQTLVWLGMALRGRRGTGLSALRKMGLLLPGEASSLEEAYAFLLKTRAELHLATQSKQDQLTVRMQKIIAERFGYGARGDHLGVELFMKDYYMHTRTIYHITEDIIEEMDQGQDVGVLLGRRRKFGGRHALFVRLNIDKLKKNPLYVFERQKEKGLKLDRPLKRRLEEALGNMLTSGSDTRRMRKSFPELLKDGRNITTVLRAMHETGFLGRIIPEYNHLTCLKRYDLYHHYTADEHSFRVVQNLEELSKTSRGRSNLLVRLYSEISGKRFLLLAALLHDIGKIHGRGHARKGAELSRTILKRLGLKGNAIDFISFIIEHHLLMSHFSQRRDPTDIGTIQSFCSKVRSRTSLKFLTLLTYADLKATSPVVWTKWKDNLLWGLYLKAIQFMAKREKKPDAVYKARKKELLRAFAPGVERDHALRHLDLLPGRYLLTMSASQVKRHMTLIDSLDGEKGVVAMNKRKFATEVTFCTFDKPFRLSELCGLLAVNDLNILFAFAFTRQDGKVIDIFQVENLISSAPIGQDRLEGMQKHLTAVLQGKEDIRARFERHIAKWKRRKDTAIPVPLRVEFDNDLSADFTIIDIFAQDEPGLLYRITRALSEEGLTIYRARISTEANRAIDAFYVHDRDGQKIKSAQRIKKIRDALEKSLGTG